MKSYLKVITNVFLTSIGLSVLLGSLLRVDSPINQGYKINRKINIAEKSRRSIEKELKHKKSNISLFYNNKLEGFERLQNLINKWELLINKNSDLDVSAFLSH